MRWYHWVGLSALGLGLLLLWILAGGKGPNPIDKLNLEVEAINAKADVKRLEADMGTIRAQAHVEAKYRTELKAMNTQRRARADKLKANPAKLAAFIIRGKT